MRKKPPRKTRRAIRNDLARMHAMGILNLGSFADFDDAQRAVAAWALAASTTGVHPGGLAAMLSKRADKTRATLARREYWLRLEAQTDSQVVAQAFEQHRAEDVLVLFARDGRSDRDLTVVRSLVELKEIRDGR